MGSILNWLKSLLYGLIYGLSEFLPISSSGHRALFSMLFDDQLCNPVSDLIIHICLLIVVIILDYAAIMRIRRNNKITAGGRGRLRADRRTQYDMRLIKTAAIPLICLLLLNPIASDLAENPVVLALFFVLNGVLVYIPSRLLHANKDAKNMSSADAFLIGAAGGLSVFPGFSRIGASVSAATARGADYKESFHWALLLSIPALVTQIVLDCFAIPGATISPVAFGYYFLVMIGALGGSYISITIMRMISANAGITGFAFYSWGAAMLSLILYMIV